MLSLQWPKNGSFNYVRNNYTRLGSLLRATSLNEESFKEYVDSNTFVTSTNSILGGLLRHLAIDPEWDLDYVIGYARLRSYSLATPFKLTSISNQGSVIRNGFYKEGVLERWALIENENHYEELGLGIDSLSPLIPLYSTMTNRGYKPFPLRKDTTDDNTSLGILGVDIVELAIGWWLYMRQERLTHTGIEDYLVRHVYVKTQMFSNQLTVINILYEVLINNRSIDEMLETDTVTFMTLNENRYFKEYLEFTIENLTNKRMLDLGQVINSLPSLYQNSYFNFVDSGKSGMMAQSCWIWEPPILKMYAIYLSLGNKMGYKAGDINTVIDRVRRVMPRNLDRINDRVFRGHLKELADKVFELNDLNYK